MFVTRGSALVASAFAILAVLAGTASAADCIPPVFAGNSDSATGICSVNDPSVSGPEGVPIVIQFTDGTPSECAAGKITFTRTWTASYDREAANCEGGENSATFEQSITLSPTLDFTEFPADEAINCGGLLPAATAEAEECGEPVSVTFSDDVVPVCGGEVIRTYTATGSCGPITRPQTISVLTYQYCPNDPLQASPQAVPVPELISSNIVGSNYEIQIGFSDKFNRGVQVAFEGDNVNENCQFQNPGTPLDPWQTAPFTPLTYPVDDEQSFLAANYWKYFDQTPTSATLPCAWTAKFSASVQNLLANCGFRQETRTNDPDHVHFVNTVKIMTNRTVKVCLNGPPCDDGNRDIEQDQIGSYEYVIDIRAPLRVPATSDGVSVFGDAINLALVRNVTVSRTYDPEDDDEDIKDWPGQYKVEFEFITSVQYPYSLKVPTSATTDFPSAYEAITAVEVAEPCAGPTVVPTTGAELESAACQQAWKYSFILNEDCEDGTDFLNTNAITFTFEVECQTNFAVSGGACAAPTLTNKPAVTFTLTSPNICPQEDRLELDATIDTYILVNPTATNDLNDDMNLFAPATSTGATATGAVSFTNFKTSNGVFSFESRIFLEVNATIDNEAATLSSMNVTSVTVSNGDESVTPYNDDAPYGANDIECKSDGTDAEKAACYIVVKNTWSNTVGSSHDVDDSRARIGIQWSAPIMPRQAAQVTQDAAVVFTITVGSIVTYAEGLNTVSATNPVIQALHSETKTKSAMLQREFKVASLTANSNFVVTIPANPGAGGGAGSSSSSLSMSSPLAVGVVAGGAGVVLAAILIAVVVVRRNNKKNATAGTGAGSLTGSESSSSSSVSLVVVQNKYSGMTASDVAADTSPTSA